MTKKENITSLTIKANENNKVLPLGIKSTVQGIEHFTNWDKIANSIDETGNLRKENSKLKSVKFKNQRHDDISTRGYTVETFGNRNAFGNGYGVDDSWDINKIKILDDLAFVAQEEYTDLEKYEHKTLSQFPTRIHQYFVTREFAAIKKQDTESEGGTSGLAGGGGTIISPGYSSWDASGAYTGHMPFMPGSGYAAGPYAGGFTIKYTPSTNTWEISGTIPSTGGWGGSFSGSATYDACSGGSATNLDITISGSHYCTATSATETYSGTVRLNISPGNSADESACSAGITLNSVTWGTPSQYNSSGGCYISYSNSSITASGYTSPVTDGGGDDTGGDDVDPERRIKLTRQIGSLTVDLGASQRNGSNDSENRFPFLNTEGLLYDDGESGSRKLTALSGDYENLYIKLYINRKDLFQDGVEGLSKDGLYFKFGGFLNNDMSKSNIFVNGRYEGAGPDGEDLEDNITLSGINFVSPSAGRDVVGVKNLDVNDKDGVPLVNDFGPFVPPSQDGNISLPPVNYSFLNPTAYPKWNNNLTPVNDHAIYGSDYSGFLRYLTAMYHMGFITEQEYRLNKPYYDNPFFGPGNEEGNPNRKNFQEILTSLCNAYACFALPFNNYSAPSDGVLFEGKCLYRSAYEGVAVGNRFSEDGLRGRGENHWRSGEPDETFIPQNVKTIEQRTSFGASPGAYVTDDPKVKGDMPLGPENESFGGYYYLLFDDAETSNPKIAGVQFDIADNNQYREANSFVNPIFREGIGTGTPDQKDAQKGLGYFAYNCELTFVKILPVRKCGKVDIYRRKSGTPSSISSGGRITSEDHGLKDNDVIEISGALYDTPGTGVADLHPLNGRFSVRADGSDHFFLNDAPSHSDIANLRKDKIMVGAYFFGKYNYGITWRSVSNSIGEESEGWNYEGSIFSPTGRNGYFTGLYNKDGADALNKLASQEEFYKNSGINFSNVENGILDFSKDLGDLHGIGKETVRGVDTTIQRLLDTVPKTPSEMRICGIDNIRSLGIGANQLYPYTSENYSKFLDKAAGPDDSENYSGCRFGCDFDVKFSNNSGTSKVYTLAVGERGSDVSVNLFGLSAGTTDSEGHTANSCSFADDNEVIKFDDARRFIPEYLPYGKTHVIDIYVNENGKVTNVVHRDSLFGGGNGIRHGKQPRGNDLQDQTERNPWTDLEREFRKQDFETGDMALINFTNKYAGLSIKGAPTFSLSDVFSSEKEYLGDYLTPVQTRGGGSARYQKSSYWERHCRVHWFAQNIPDIYAFRGGQKNGEFLNPLKRDFGKMFRPSLEQDNNQKIISYFGNETGIKTIDRFNANDTDDRYGYWSIFPWVDSYGKSVGLSVDSSLDGSDSSKKIAVLSASTSLTNITFNPDQDELPQPTYVPKNEKYDRFLGLMTVQRNDIGQLNLVYLDDGYQFGYTQIAAGGTSGYPTRDWAFGSLNNKKMDNELSGSFAGVGTAEIYASCHLSYSDISFEKDRIMFSEQRLATNDSAIHVLKFTGSSFAPTHDRDIHARSNFAKGSPIQTLIRPFNFSRDSKFSLNSSILEKDTFNVGDGFGSTFKVQKDLLLTNATDTIDEFDEKIKAPVSALSIKNHTSSVLYGIDQIFVYEKFKAGIFEFSQKITASTKEKVNRPQYEDRSINPGRINDLTVPLSAMNYDNRPNGTFAWNIDLSRRYDLADTKIVLQDPQSVVIFDRDFSESEPMVASRLNRTPEITSAKTEQFTHGTGADEASRLDTSTLTYVTSTSSDPTFDCLLNVADYSKLRGKYFDLPEKTPILNYSLDGDEDFYISGMKINFNLTDRADDISTTFMQRASIIGGLIPRVVLYTRDPQGIVTRNRSSSLTSGAVSNFYSLDSTKKSKKSGAYIAPTRSATDIATSLNFDAGFMGQHRGGAQDLFFYGTLEGTTPVTAQEVFPGASPRTTLPYLYGGEKNLADFEQGCSWIAPDVYHKFTQDQISQIKPYAKIFSPTLQSDGSYSVTITSDDLGDGLDFDHFIDKGRGGIWLGFVLTNVNSFDINTCEITYQEFLGLPGEDLMAKTNSDISYQPIDERRSTSAFFNTENNFGPLKYILPATDTGLSNGNRDMSKWFNARYPYCRVGVYPGVDAQGARTVLRKRKGKGEKTKSLAAFAKATVVNPTLEISGFVTEGRRYKVSFSKKAIVDLKDSYTQDTFDRQSESTIAIGKSLTSNNSLSLKKGSFASSYQILSGTDGNVADPTAERLNRFLDKISPANILSSFDVQRPEFLSLTVAGLPTNQDVFTLMTPPPFFGLAGDASLVFSPTVETKDVATTLFAGTREFDRLNPLFMRVDIAENLFPMNLNSNPPSSIIPLNLKTVNASGGIDLAFAPPTTGSAPLFVSGPIENSGITTLSVDGSVFIEDAFPFYASGAFHSSGLAPLYTIASISKNNLISLAMNLPQSGSTPLYIRKDFDASGQAPLTIFDKAPHSGNLNLFTGTQFDVDNKGLNLFTDSPLMGTGQAPLQIDGFALTANSNRNSNTELLSVLPNGEFDKGDINGEFNEDPIDKTTSSKNVSSNSVLGNAIAENFYDRNRHLINLSWWNRNSPDVVRPSTFVQQRKGGVKYSPSLEKKGTPDPAWNFGYGEYLSYGGKIVSDNKARVIDQDLIKRFYDLHDGNVGGYIRKDSSKISFIEKDFYDSNDDVLVKAGMINDSVIEIAIYDMDDDGDLSQRGIGGKNGVLRFAPASIPIDENGVAFFNGAGLDETEIVAERGSSPIYTFVNKDETLTSDSVIDAFFPIRKKIFQRVKDDFYGKIFSEDSSKQAPFKAEWQAGAVDVCDLKVNKNGLCAISFKVTVQYKFSYKEGGGYGLSSVTFTRRESFQDTVNMVVIFDTKKYGTHDVFASNPNPYSVNGLITTFKQNFPNTFGGSIKEEDSRSTIRSSGSSFISGDDYTASILAREEHNHTLDERYGRSDLRPGSARKFAGTSYLSGTSIAFDYDDLYVNSQHYAFGEVLRLSKSRNYIASRWSVNPRERIEFKDANSLATPVFQDDFDYYARNNRRFITDFSDGYAKPFFGSKIKIFEEHQSNKSIMLVGAMLFDPYVLQTLSGSHKLNPIGAVYIFKKDKDEEGPSVPPNKWDYHGAVYGKGYTSENVKSNLSQYRGGLNSTRQIGLFGYDFDYSEGVLSVSEPGGDGDGVVNAGRIYTFDISSTPTLLKTHSASDITVNSSSVGYGDNFGTSVASFGRDDVFTFSDKTLNNVVVENLAAYSLLYEGESLVHNVRNNSSFGFGSTGSSGLLEYSRANTMNELRPYFTSKLKTGIYPEFSSVMKVWSRILSVKKIVSKNKDRLLVVRKFSFRLNSTGQNLADFSENSFNVVKLQVLDLERGANGPLFIKAANAENNLAPLFNLAPGPSGKFDLAIKPIDYCSGLAPLFLDNRNSFNDMSLHTPHVDADGNVFLPFAMNAFAPSASGQAGLFLKHQYITATPDLFMPAIGAQNSGVSLAAQGSIGEGFSASPSLVINRHIPGEPENNAIGLFLNNKNFNAVSLFEAGGASNPEMDLVVGSFIVASGVNEAPLTVKTFIPPIGPGGGYVGSGIAPLAMSGNNDAGIYFKNNNNISLFLPSKNIANTGNVLFIQRPVADASPLFINSQISSGTVPSYVTGAGIDNSGINLITRSPQTNNFNAFTRGYFD